MKAVALGQPLEAVADRLCRKAEECAPGVLCSILLVADGRLHPLAAPSLPATYVAATEGIAIGPSAGSCGTAAYCGHEVLVTDIATDPKWATFSEIALASGLAACWSSPVADETGRTVATFAFYWRVGRGPNAIERRIVETCVDILAIAIRHDRTRAEISDLAFRDRASGLPNRLAFETFAAARLTVRPAGSVVGIHYVDLDDFKTVNDTFGHRVGDLLLAAVAGRLRAAAPASAMVARLGGDEFAVCAETVDDAEQAAIAEALIAALAAPVTLEGHSLTVGASLGVARAPADGADLDRLARRADTALYAAKRAGRGTFRLFSAEMARAVEERGLLQADLAGAVGRGEFSVVYQPIVDLATGAVTGVETLVRWNHPVRGAVPPMNFIPLAEETGAIAEIGAFVLDRALADAARWPATVSVAVNVSPVQLGDAQFATRVALALARAGVAPQRLVVEVTETALLDRGGTTARSLDALKALGVAIALDDFGTGYSSLSLIRDRRFNRLKIDKSFVDGLGADPDCEAIVRCTLAVARDTGFRTTAEGIETEGQRAFLADHGCHEGQGYLISRPLPAAALEPLFAPPAPIRRRAGGLFRAPGA